MRSKTVLSWLVFGALLATTQVLGKVEPITLKELVSQSHAIVIGNVEGARPTASTDAIGGTKHEATLGVEEIVKGAVPRTILIGYFPAVSASPDFVAGERVVVFLRSSESGFTALRKMPIANDKVSVGGVLNASGTQDLTGFLKKVRALLREK